MEADEEGGFWYTLLTVEYCTGTKAEWHDFLPYTDEGVTGWILQTISSGLERCYGAHLRAGTIHPMNSLSKGHDQVILLVPVEYSPVRNVIVLLAWNYISQTIAGQYPASIRSWTCGLHCACLERHCSLS